MKQSRIFNIFVLLVIVFYSCNKSEKVLPVRNCSNETPFFITSAFNNYDNDDSEQGIKFTIVVNTELYGLISSYIYRYINDLYNEGYLADVYSSSGGNPEDLRNFLENTV